MTLRGFLGEVYRRDRVLAVTGGIQLGLLVAMLCAVPFDSRTVLGISPWIKPIKFAGSIALYLGTLAWLMGYLAGPRGLLRLVSWGVSGVMLIEIVCIAGQSARGTTSHYNVATAFDGAVFSVMGVAIGVNTLLASVLLLLFFLRPPSLAPAYLWGIRLGLGVFVLGSLEGVVMIARGAHAVGLPDGGPGLPVLNWSTGGGDLRVAHFLGLHSLQALSLAGYAVSRLASQLRRVVQVGIVLGFAILYVGVCLALFRQALAGQPLLGA